jgi:membrane-associated phospholipid phosphatase
VKTAAKIISVLFHPLLLPTYLVLVLHYFFPAMLSLKAEYSYTIIGLIFVFTFVLPSINLITLRYFGSIASLTLESRQQRVLPFTFIALLYLLVTFLFYAKLPFSQNFNKLMVIISALVVISLIITLFYKVSVHSMAVSGGLGILLPLNQLTEQDNLLWPTAGLILIAGLVMSSRLLLNAHTPREIMVGSVVGVSVGLIGMILLF